MTGVGVLGIGGGLVAAQLAASDDPCDDARSQLSDVWDEPRRAEAKATMLGTDLPFAPATWDRVEVLLDDYADAWSARRQAICTSASDSEQAAEDRQRRLDCMHARARTLRATVDVLRGADVEVVTNAVALASSLPGFERCDDLEALRAAVPPPEDAAVRAEVDTLRDELASIQAAAEAGTYEGLLDRSSAALARAETLGHAPLTAEALSHQGVVLRAEGQYDAAEAHLTRAHEAATEHRHDVVALRTAQELASVVGVDKAEHDAGAVWGNVGVSIAKRGGDDVDIGRSLDRLATVLNGQGKYDDARRRLEEAAQLLETALGREHLALAVVHNNLGIVDMNQGHYDDAVAHHERVLAVRTKVLGDAHPHVAISLSNIGTVRRQQGRHDEALDFQRRAREIREASFGPDHPIVATSLSNEGVVFMGKGEYARAQRAYEGALRIREQTLGPKHPDIASTLGNLASALEAPRRLRSGTSDARTRLADPGGGPRRRSSGHRNEPDQPCHRAGEPRRARAGACPPQAGTSYLREGPRHRPPVRRHQPRIRGAAAGGARALRRSAATSRARVEDRGGAAWPRPHRSGPRR